MYCPFGFTTHQRSRLRLVKKLTGEFMRVNKLDFIYIYVQDKTTILRNGMLILGLTDLTLNRISCGCFLLFTPYRERDFTIIITYKLVSLNYLVKLPDEVCVIRRNRSGEINKLTRYSRCFVLLTSVHLKKKLKKFQNRTFVF